MPKLDHIYLVNAAGFDEVEFPVGGHCQIFGGNGHGKSTLLRAVLFFYLGTNDKPPYSLDETKKDLISYYLGDPPSYLIYGVARGEGQPSFHIAVSRPTGKIQFYFVDAPYRRDYFVDGQMVLPMEDVQKRWREAKCVVETFSSYEDFHHRIYGIIPSAYAVFRPATKNSAQVGVLSRIISGIFTVSQLEADKLKSALTCGVRRDAQAAELDLAQLKNQLTHFHRVNRAVRTYLHHEQDAIELVGLAESFEMVRDERQRALEDLVRAAKLLPEERCRLVDQDNALKNEREAVEAAHAAECVRINQIIDDLGKEIAVLEDRIKEAGVIQREYNSKEIARKTKEVNSLPEREEEQRVAERQLEALTAKYGDENQRRTHLLAVVHQSWTEAYARIQQQRLAIEEDFRKASEKLDEEKEAARVRMELERAASAGALSPRRNQLDVERTALNKDWKVFGELSPPPEIAETEAKMNRADQRQREEGARQGQHRNELALAKEKLKGERERLERDAGTERDRITESIGRMQTERSRFERELEAFDTSLARFFQKEAPDQWPDAAKTLNRETLFSNAETLDARSSTAPGAWGVEFSTDTLPEPAQSFDRDALAKSLREVQKCLAEEKDALLSAQSRFVSDADAFEQTSSQEVSALQTKILASGELRIKARDEGVRFENKLINLRSQFAAMKSRCCEDLEKRETAWAQATSLLQKESADMEAGFHVRLKTLEEDFRIRKTILVLMREEQRTTFDRDEARATGRREEEFARVEQESRERLAADGADTLQLAATQKRASHAEQEVKRISDVRDEVAEYRKKKVEWIDQLPSWESELRTRNESLQGQKSARQQASERHRVVMENFETCQSQLNMAIDAVTKDEEAVSRFRKDPRFVSEFGYFERQDLTAAAFHQPGAAREFLNLAEQAHHHREDIDKRGDGKSKAFLRYFDPETLDKKVLGFSPMHDYFNWFIFVGNELRPFVNHHGIAGLKRTQTEQFEQLIRNICNKNAAFDAGIRQVRQTAESVQARLAETNFVDVLDSIELKVERVDNQLTRTLASLEAFAGISFGQDNDLFGKRADQGQVDQAIEHFERLVKEIARYLTTQLSLTDYFDFLLRVHENGRDMSWRKSLNHIGSTGTDYLVKMLIYLALIEVYRERAIDSKVEATVHCVLDETGVLAPKYVRCVLAYAEARGIILVTAGHSQQTTGFESWMFVRKVGSRFAGQKVLRKVLKCD
jgi:Protein of unknown function (DUF3584)